MIGLVKPGSLVPPGFKLLVWKMIQVRFFLWQKFESEFFGSLGMVDGKIGGLVVWDSTRGAFNITVPFITGSRIRIQSTVPQTTLLTISWLSKSKSGMTKPNHPLTSINHYSWSLLNKGSSFFLIMESKRSCFVAQLPLYQGAQTPRCYWGSSRRPAEKSNRRPVSGTSGFRNLEMGGGNRDPHGYCRIHSIFYSLITWMDPWKVRDRKNDR